MFKIVLAALIATMIQLAAPSATAQTLRALTADTLSPFSRAEADAMPGFNVELVRLIAERAGFDLEIEWMPWKRAQAVVAQEPGLLLFGATRTAAREPQYDWVTNLLTVQRVFLTMGAPIDSTEAARALPHVGARSVYYRALEEAGFTNLEEGLIDANLRKLRSGRVDAVYTASARAVFAWTQEMEYPLAELTIGAPVDRSDIWLAASRGTDPTVIDRLDAAAAALRADGSYAALHAKYFGSLPIFESARPDQRPTGVAG